MNRGYQTGAIEGSVKSWDAGIARQLHVMATGTGKTHCFAQLPGAFQTRLPGQTLVLAHREELIDQAVKKLQFENLGRKVGKEKGSYTCDPVCDDIIVASVASLHEERRKKLNVSKVDKLTIDEAHHSAADSYEDLVRYFQMHREQQRDPKTFLLNGWTATPQRGDGAPLAKIFDEIVTVYTIREAIEDGWLVDVRGYRVRTETSLDNVKVVAGEFNQKQLADTVDTPERNMQAYKAWLSLAEDRQTIGFCVSIEHARHCAEVFSKHDVLADYIWGDDPKRKEKLEKFRAGEIEVLFNCDVLTEGFDMWQVECVMNLAPTKSPVKYVQRVGRGTRLEELTYQYNLKDPGLPNVKSDCVVIDLVDNCTRNSLITLPTLMGLPATTDLQGKSMVWAVKQLEAAQQEFPHIDFSKVADISKLKQFIQEVNLFDVEFTAEVKQESQLAWHPAATGGYVLLLPARKEKNEEGEETTVRESVTVRQNALDKWEIFSRLEGKNYKGVRESLAEAFKAADKLVLKMRGDSLNLLKQEQGWHKDKATDAQIKTLKRFMKGKQIPPDLSKGKASRLISAYLAGKQ